ncbi:glycoside hydrolase family 19 protein [Sphingomonas sp. AP4-R1]|uniref:glycoside hydrolase family 19 protein n=1 Tax=Sphingomonas sp. AP4-R1 TaxID=2735134 RepID=UPI001493B1AA|nr:glycoside hydrolase family 19 protein [Sphingomonas sp. AP4-R1]QJU56716.1 glycoside hydrolase family 19 protein [Sphingomonas sp. AP4-R1]
MTRFDPSGRMDAAFCTSLFAFAADRPPDEVLRAIGAAGAAHLAAYGMTTPARLAEFVAQTAHETGGYRRFEEDLHYSAEGLARTWPGRFALSTKAAVKRPNALAIRLAGRPEAIANSVYARAAEGNVQPGDGWRYRGRGMLQLTFRNNYRAAGKRLGLDLEARPELAADPATSLLIALDFWRRAGVNVCCDAGDYVGARGLTNCGSRTPNVAPIGLEDVAKRRARLLAVLV